MTTKSWAAFVFLVVERGKERETERERERESMRVRVCHAVRLYVHVVTTLCAHVEASRIVCECVDAEAGVVDAQRLIFLCGPGLRVCRVSMRFWLLPVVFPCCGM